MTRDEALAWRPEIVRPGWSYDILPWEHAIAPHLPDRVRWVTLGAYCGRSLLFLAEELQRLGKTGGHLIGIDDNLPRADYPETQLGAFVTNRRRVTEEWKAPRVRVEYLVAHSPDCADLFEDRSLDAVFIDADHTEAAVRADIAAWTPKLRHGGLLAGHDYKAHEFGVKAAVDALIPEAVRRHEGSVWWTRVAWTWDLAQRGLPRIVGYVSPAYP